MSVPQISVQELARLRTDNPALTIVDVREADELQTARIDGVVHIPLGQIPQQLDAIPAGGPVYVLCHHGGRSERAVRFLHTNGRTDAINVAGGIDEWSQFVDPSVARY